ncbi:hypothetical protein HJC23_009915 [Cyclotella cryptica]|uniref:Alkyl transferase n=1 Tax=Cyclotella cryptica TaxID=29204 RepID=A0ABD3P1P3_9STRA|eukprot:CCRYP_018312-RA/>CCRYP_018312-RA protein AED:0.36 eAED:0.36 QI:0/-1/0/1/-1/1/1/0/321
MANDHSVLESYCNLTASPVYPYPSNLEQSASPVASDSETENETNNFDVPRHIAFICDGNSRWAELKSLPKSMGHAAGADRVINVISRLRQSQPQQPTSTGDKGNALKCQRVQYCTLFAFSTENWSRPASEIATIFTLIEKVAIQYQQHDAIRNGQIQIEVVGNLDDNRIPEGTRSELRKLQRDSQAACDKRRDQEIDNHDVLTVCLAINYGGRADILLAAKKLAQSIVSGEIPPAAINDEIEISSRLSTSSLPDPDLIIRTGGEKRLSNFLLWNAAYSELYFSDVLWPDFDEVALKDALVWYGKRNRRFGGRGRERNTLPK